MYRTTRQLGFFQDHDELYWNVTGNGWSFTISNVTASVELPGDAASHVIETNAFTGYQGERGRDFEIGKGVYGNPQFTTTKTLSSNQGLTIFVSWPKGYVHPPNSWTKLVYFFEDNRGVLLALGAFLAIFFYYLFVWYMVGRDPKKGTIIPLFHPPQDLSPAAVRYLWKMGYDQKVFSVAVVNLAVKGYIKIKETVPLESINILGLGKAYVIERNMERKEEASAEELAVFDRLLGTSTDVFAFSNAHYEKIDGAIDSLKRELSRREENVYFLTNQGYFGFGIFLSAGAGYLIFTLLASGYGALVAILLGVLLGAINTLFYRLLKAPTLQGRRVMDQLEGFRQFLSVTEKDRLNYLNPPEKTPELFEKYLPYALALDVEQRWSEQFSEVLAKAAQGGKEYNPSWYSGSNWSYNNPSRFTSNLGGAFTTTIAAAATPPGSSSGGGFSGGGGGFSGGGGGGGGGGGW
jgi:hypothetical protein